MYRILIIMIYIYNKLFIISNSKYIEHFFKDNDMIFFKLKDNNNIFKNILKYYCNTLFFLQSKFDINLYNQCLQNNIYIQNNLDVINNLYNNFYPYNINKSSLFENEDNLLIESIEYGYPIIIKVNNISLYKCNSSLEFCKYYKYILNYSVNNFNNNKLYFINVNENFLKLQIHFFKHDDKIIILEIFKILYIELKNKILYCDNNFNTIYFKNIYDSINEIMKHIKINNYICEIIFIYQNENFYFCNLDCNINIDKFYLYYHDIYNINIFNIYLFNKIENKKSCNNNILFYDYDKNIKSEYIIFANNIHDKLIINNINFELKKIIDINLIKNINIYKTYIKNINIKFNLCKIYNKTIKIKNINKCIDNYNSRLSNIIINNKIHENIIEEIDNLHIYFYNKTNVCITGKSIDIFINNIKYNTYKILKINKFDSLKIKNKTNNYYYISFSNGIKEYNKINNELKFNKSNNNFNIIDKINPKNNNKFNYIIKNNKYITIFNNYKWYVKEINNNNIILKTNTIFNILNNNKAKKYKYPIGSIILINKELYIVKTYDFSYIKGIYIGCIIYNDLWKINYTELQKNILFINVSYEYAKNKNNNMILILDNLTHNKKIIINETVNKINNNNEYLFNYHDKKYNIDIYSNLYGDKYIIVKYKSNNIILNLIRFKFIMKQYDIILGNNFYILEIIDKDKILIEILKLEKSISLEETIKIKILNIPLLNMNNNIKINDICIVVEIYKNKIYIKDKNNTIYLIHNNVLYFNKKIIGYIIIDNNICILDMIKFNIYKEDIYNSILYNFNKNNYYFDNIHKIYNINDLITLY